MRSAGHGTTRHHDAPTHPLRQPLPRFVIRHHSSPRESRQTRRTDRTRHQPRESIPAIKSSRPRPFQAPQRPPKPLPRGGQTLRTETLDRCCQTLATSPRSPPSPPRWLRGRGVCPSATPRTSWLEPSEAPSSAPCRVSSLDYVPISARQSRPRKRLHLTERARLLPVAVPLITLKICQQSKKPFPTTIGGAHPAHSPTSLRRSTDALSAGPPRPRLTYPSSFYLS